MFLNFLLFGNIHRKLPNMFDFSKNNFYKKMTVQLFVKKIFRYLEVTQNEKLTSISESFQF
jgi:hypothetical protein